MNILQINSSLRGDASVSTKFANTLSQKLKQKYNANLIVRDLEKFPVSPLNVSAVHALFAKDFSHKVMKEHTELIKEIKQVDTLVIGAPMYNFTISSSLKNYFDAITRSDATFFYTKEGPVGLLDINEAFIVFSRGGLYNKRLTFQEDFLDTMLTFLGVKKIHHLFIEGLNMGHDIAQKSLLQANEIIEKI